MSNANEPSLIKIARADGGNSITRELNLGERVRQLRKDKNWTLEQAAKEAGLARSTLSKIENDQMSPTFDAVKKLAEGLGISVPQLFTPPTSDQVMARLSVTKQGAGREHITPTYEHEMLAPELKSKAMLPYRARIRARDFDEFGGWVRHDGEEFLYVLSGVVMFYTEFYEAVELRRGDSAYYDAAMGHNLISTSQEDALVLWITTLNQ